MEIEIAVPPLRNKLMKMLADDKITSPELRDQVIKLINMLESLPLISEVNEEKAVPSILDFVNEAEDITDEFILTTEEHSQKRTSQFPSRQNRKNYTDQLEFLTLRFEVTRVDLERSVRSSGHQISPTEEDTVRWENIPCNLDEESGIFGRESKIDDLVKRLLEHDDSRVIPVVDVAGSGKTTLVRTIYSRVDIKRQFDCRAWVYVSKGLDERNLLADLLQQVTVEMTKEQELPTGELKTRLNDSLKNKTFLIVLDGVHTTILDHWDSLSRALPDTNNGSKIILTTVDADVAQRANKNSSIFQLGRLSDEESWKRFLNKVRESVEQQGNPEILPSQLYMLTNEKMWPLLSKKLTAIEDEFKMPDFKPLKEKILRTCNGVPLPILMLGELMSTINLIEWSKVIENATSGRYPTGILAMSYQGLRYELKSCLLYMFLFPREYEIPVRRLFGLWIAENMVKPTRKAESVAEDLAQIYFNELVGRNMIQVAKWRSDGRPKACHMPGIIYDFLWPKALKMRYVRFQDPNPIKVRRCAYYVDYTDKYPSDIESLRSCVSFDTRKRGSPALGIGMLLIKITGKRSFGLLVVLDLEGVYKPLLPEELGKLLLLRYLGLRSTVIDSLPLSVGKLQCLETLDVKHTNLTSLPSSILKGKKLRHLYLNGISLDMSVEQQSSGSAGDLQTLSGISIGKDSIRNGLGKYTGLRKLGLTCHSSAMGEVVASILTLTNLRTLKLRSVQTFIKPSEFTWKLEMKEHTKLTHLYFHGRAELSQLPQNLEILTLSLSSLNEDPMSILGELQQLKTLRLLAKSHLGKKMNCKSGSFPQLRILKIWMLEELDELTIEEGAMPLLRELEIRRCKELKKIDGLHHISTLKELILINMEKAFVEDLKGSMKRKDVFINTKEWKLSSSDLWLD